MPWMETEPTSLSRRTLLSVLGGFVLSPTLGSSVLANPEILAEPSDDTPLFASAFKRSNGDYGIGIFNDFGQVLAVVTLPGRGHDIAVSPDKRVLVAFARRPGTFALIIRPFDEVKPKVLASRPGRHFYGHGCFSPDGRLIYMVENDFDAARGVIGVYDLSGSGPRFLGEIDSHGIGPHDILLSPDGRYLIVANGGIKTHPDSGREKLNLPTMAPSVVHLDRVTGDLIASQSLAAPLHQLSLRHMALDGQGRVWVGGQFEGPNAETPPLVAVLTRDGAPVLLDTPRSLQPGLENYIGSVAANRDGSVIATSAPRGGKTLFWEAATGRLLGARSIPDGCGVAAIDRSGFLVSDGNGALSLVAEPGAQAEILARPPGVSWDNHMVSLS